MKFKDFDAKMREFETRHDTYIDEGKIAVVRLDGRGFSKLTKRFDKPFDAEFYRIMRETVEHLMKESGLGFLYAHQHSDEISLLLNPTDYSFGNKLRKLNSLLASSASVFFSFAASDVLGERILASFDSRVSLLDSPHDISDYYRWRQADSKRNAINAYAYYGLLHSGMSTRAATSRLNRVLTDEKKAIILDTFGIDFDSIPRWQLLGQDTKWEVVTKKGLNPVTNTEVLAQRKQLTQVEDPDYSEDFFTGLLG